MNHVMGMACPILLLNATIWCVCPRTSARIFRVHGGAILVRTAFGSHIAYNEGWFGEGSYLIRVSLDFLERPWPQGQKRSTYPSASKHVEKSLRGRHKESCDLTVCGLAWPGCGVRPGPFARLQALPERGLLDADASPRRLFRREKDETLVDSPQRLRVKVRVSFCAQKYSLVPTSKRYASCAILYCICSRVPRPVHKVADHH